LKTDDFNAKTPTINGLFLVLLRLHLRSESACIQVVYVGLYASMLANSRILTACNLYYLHSFIPLHESINRRFSSFNSHTKNLIDCVGFPDFFMDHLTVQDNTIIQPALVTDARRRIEDNRI